MYCNGIAMALQWHCNGIAMALQWHCNGRHNCGPDCQVCIITWIEIMIGAIVMGAEMTIAMDIEMAILILI